MIYGAIIGDVVGSRFEFDRGGKTKKFKLFTVGSTFTDDTMMTIAVAWALKELPTSAHEADVKKCAIKYMQIFGRMCPNAGYGASFIKWLYDKNPKPYGSWGNGSAMRTSAVGWRYDSLERTRQVAKWIAEVSHNHPEGVKGADCTASVIYLGRTGKSKEEIRRFVEDNFDYDLTESLDSMRARHKHIESCQDSMPKALVSFFEGKDFEDVIRNAVSLGGDTDTLGAIAGGMAEAYYGIPEHIKKGCMECLPRPIIDWIRDVEKR